MKLVTVSTYDNTILGSRWHTRETRCGYRFRIDFATEGANDVNSFGGDRDDLSLHPTVKPVAMVADAIRDCSHRKAIILDAFVGSGTTLIAAEKTGRRGYGIEIDPAYCDVTIRRLHAVCGLDAVLDATGKPFTEIEALRAAAAPPPVGAAPRLEDSA